MAREGLTHSIVYADREHFANIAYLTNFDPRFEESLLIVSRDGDPLIVVGNECEGYLGVSPLYTTGKLRSERFQPFSLLNQPRDKSRRMRDIFAGEGIGAGSRVGCIGWKYFEDSEHPDGAHAIDLPAYLVDTLRDLAGREAVVNATALMMHPGYGLSSSCSASEIAFFEYTNVLASEGVKRMLFGLHAGMTDNELAGLSGYTGEPLSCHMTLVTEANRDQGLSGPVGATIALGSPLATNVAYWGSNICRAGWVAILRGSAARGTRLRRGLCRSLFRGHGRMVRDAANRHARRQARGADCREAAVSNQFRMYLNPGHLIHLDEWLSRRYAGSTCRCIRLGHPGRCDPLLPDLLLHADGGWHRAGRRGAERPAAIAVPGMLPALPETARVHDRCAGHRSARGSAAAVQRPRDSFSFLSAAQADFCGQTNRGALVHRVCSGPSH